ncbi:hypothetical protein [Streptomyces sp. NEAU-S7GS2]|uniref:hypothetical protein n=1 Tax=Streptomyces sp. NEAU-S7GS2 TaxID=2202000 RepID=UPI001EF50BCA|nr:hypothetical protein [Streptomyces sp. NEAU-S7GS2]
MSRPDGPRQPQPRWQLRLPRELSLPPETTRGALRAVADARSIAERLDAAQGADTWFGYPLQKHHVHLSQAFTLMGRTREAHAEQEAALFLTRSPSVMTRALLAMDAATCLKVDGDHSAAADATADIWQRLPAAYRDGLIRSRADALHQSLVGSAHDRTLAPPMSTL